MLHILFQENCELEVKYFFNLHIERVLPRAQEQCPVPGRTVALGRSKFSC